MADYIHIDARHGASVEVLPSTTRWEIDDWDEEYLKGHALHVTNMDMGFVLEGTKKQLVAYLEEALRQAKALPDDDPGGE